MNKQIKLKNAAMIIVLTLVLCATLTLAACSNGQHTNPTPEDNSIFGEWIVQTPATCEADGLQYRTNKKGERQEEIIPALGHSYGEWTTVKIATEMEEGMKESVCSRCHNKKQQILGALVDGTYGLEFTYWESQDMYYLTGAGDAIEVKDLIIPTRYKGKPVIYVYKNSLNDMPNLETVTFASDSSYTYIYPNAFSGCNKLKSLEIPASVTYLPSSCIENCDALEEVNVSADNTSFCSVNGVVYTKDMKSLVLYPQAKQGVYTVPATLTSISYKDIFKTTNYPLATAYGISAFDVESGNTAFGVDARGILYSSDMKKLFAYPLADTAEELIINDENTNSIQSYAFANNKYLNSFKFTSDNGYKSILGYAFYNTKIKNIEMEGIYSLESYAIYFNSDLQNVILNSGNTSKFSIHYYAMASNPQLKKVILPHIMDEKLSNGVLPSYDPFWGCTSLNDIAFDQGDSAYVSVNGTVFTKDMSILLFVSHDRSDLTLPDTLKAINTNALNANKKLKFETVDGLKYYQNWLVGVDDEEITEVKVKDGTVGIAAHALNKLTVDKLSLPESVKYLSYRALAESTPTEFIYHNNFEYIANSAFSQFGYVGGILDIGTPTYVGDYAIGYTKFDEIRVGFKNNGNVTYIDGSSMGGAFYQSKAKVLMYGPYVGEIIGKACNKMTNLAEVYIASESLCTTENDAYKTYLSNSGYMTGHQTITKTKWIANTITIEPDVTDFMKNAFLGGGFNDDQSNITTTVDGITYRKYYRT